MPPTQKQLDAATKFLEGVLAKVPAEQRDTVRAAITGNQEILADIGDGVMMRGDYTSQTQQLQRDRDAIQAYYDRENPKVEKAAKLLERFPDGIIPDDFGNPDPNANRQPAIDPKALTDDLLGKVGLRVQESEKGAAAFMAKLTNLSNQHLATFGKPLDTEALVANPRIYEVGLDAAYREAFADDYRAKAEAEQQAKIDAAVGAERERLTAEFAKQRVAQPYPTANAGRNPVMAALESQRAEALEKPELASRPYVNRVDIGAAAEEYQRLATTGA